MFSNFAIELPEPLEFPERLAVKVHQGNLPPRGLYTACQWWHHFYKRPDVNMEKAFNEAQRYFFRTRGFLTKSQVNCLTYNWFGIPQICGEINKKAWSKRIKFQLKTLQKQPIEVNKEVLATAPLKIVSRPPLRTCNYRVFKAKNASASERHARLYESLGPIDEEMTEIVNCGSHHSYVPVYEYEENDSSTVTLPATPRKIGQEESLEVTDPPSSRPMNETEQIRPRMNKNNDPKLFGFHAKFHY